MIKSGDRILLVRRRFSPGSGKWSVPGGLVELGETVRKAALREVYEETGLRIRLDRLLDVVDYIERDREGKIRFHYVLVDFLAHIEEPAEVRLSEEASEAKWVKISEALNYNLTSSLRALLSGVRL